MAQLLSNPGGLDGQSTLDHLSRFRDSIRPTNPDYIPAILIDCARLHDVPWGRLGPPERLWRFGWGARGTVMFESLPLADSYLGITWSGEKAYSKRIFRELGAPVAASVIVRDESGLPAAAAEIGFPCVAKPLDGGRSVGVSTNIRSHDELHAAFNAAAAKVRMVCSSSGTTRENSSASS